jgi:hypothetical protein
VYGRFRGDNSFWNDFSNNSKDILGALDVGQKDDRGHAVLVYAEGFDHNGIPYFAARNSWGKAWGEGMGTGLRLPRGTDDSVPTSGCFRTGIDFPWNQLWDVYFRLSDCSAAEKNKYTEVLKSTAVNPDRIILLEFHMKTYTCCKDWFPTDLTGTVITTFPCPIGITVNGTHSGRRSDVISSRTYNEALCMSISHVRYQQGRETTSPFRNVLTYLEIVLTGEYPTHERLPVKESFRYGVLRKNDSVQEIGPIKAFELPKILQDLLVDTFEPMDPTDDGSASSAVGILDFLIR